MAFDPDRGKTLLFGGDDFTQAFNDLWEYDYGSNTWTHLNATNPPPPRQMHNMVYDQENQLIILFGGRRTGGGAAFSDTRAYKRSTNSWSNMNPVNSPPVRDHINLAYDIEHHKTLLFCGPKRHDKSGLGTWAYDSTTNIWLKLPLGSQSPTGDHVGFVYNQKLGSTTYFGNREGDNELEVWNFNYETLRWTLAASQVLPRYKEHFGMAYDSENDTYLVTGGFPNNKNWLLKLTSRSN